MAERIPAMQSDEMTFPERNETERLLLRWPTEADAEEIFARYASDPGVTRYLLWPPHRSVDETREFQQQQIAERELGTTFNWLAYLKSNDMLLGSIGCRIDKHIVQFGYCYARDAWGRGYATEAARAMVGVWLESPAIWRVQAYCDPENSASARVLEKAGLTREGLLRKHASAPNLGNTPRDVFIYARVRAS